MISPLDRWYSTNCCLCCHVRTGTIILGIWYLIINAVVLLILLTALSDPDQYHLSSAELGNDFDFMDDANICIATAISLLMILICGMATYGAYKQHAAWIIPFFCYQIFDFALNTLVAISVVVYPNTIQDYLQQLPGNFPYKEEIMSMNAMCLVLIVLIFIGCILAFKAYLIACVWNCYRYVSGRGSADILVYVTTNDTTRSVAQPLPSEISSQSPVLKSETPGKLSKGGTSGIVEWVDVCPGREGSYFPSSPPRDLLIEWIVVACLLWNMKATVISLIPLLLCGVALADFQERPRSRPQSRERNDAVPQSNSVESPCRGKPLDFMFVIDSSRSVRPHDYEKVKTFIVNILQFLDVGPKATRVGLIQYGSVVQSEFSLKAFQRKADVEEAVRNMVHLATGTMTGLAIQYTMNVALTEAEGARPLDMHIPRIAMIVTDGRPQDTVADVAARARESGIQIFTIGVGRVDMSTLRAIGSEPHDEHVFLVANFSQIETLTSVFQSKLCGGKNLCAVTDHRCDHMCINTPGSYMCRCKKGYTVNPDGKTCKAQDVCAVVDHGCQHYCVSLPGSYECRCREGYQLREDGKTCSRTDYCDLGTHGCEHDCVNTVDSYICRCRRGFILNSDGKTCRREDLCALGTHGCDHKCVNTADSYVCRCRQGYRLNPDGKTCKEIDHCSLGTHGCDHECVNTEDSFVCRCREGYMLNPDGKTCKSKFFN
ncbi:MATN2 protein, partial [Atractosteus spatula]|nr:MATN2 protein [Atractosteus spatula]